MSVSSPEDSVHYDSPIDEKLPQMSPQTNAVQVEVEVIEVASSQEFSGPPGLSFSASTGMNLPV